jgi:hypothetical protein
MNSRLEYHGNCHQHTNSSYWHVPGCSTLVQTEVTYTIGIIDFKDKIFGLQIFNTGLPARLIWAILERQMRHLIGPTAITWPLHAVGERITLIIRASGHRGRFTGLDVLAIPCRETCAWCKFREFFPRTSQAHVARGIGCYRTVPSREYSRAAGWHWDPADRRCKMSAAKWNGPSGGVVNVVTIWMDFKSEGRERGKILTVPSLPTPTQ